MGIKELLGITKWQKEIDLKVALEKLEFLASELEKGNDRAEDLRFWKESLEVLESLNNGKSFLVKKLYEAYSHLFNMFLRKHDWQNK